MTTRSEDPTHARYLTFGCYRRKQLFAHEELAFRFVHAVDAWRREQAVQLWAYVVMPNHVHLLVHTEVSDLGKDLGLLKLRYGFQALQWLQVHHPVRYEELQALDHGTIVHRFWQAGGGYDRNIFSDVAVRKAMTYIHNNPVRAGIVEVPEMFTWSSARYWLQGEETPVAPDVPEWWRDQLPHETRD